MRNGGARRLAVVAAVAVGLVLVLAAMPGCGSGCPTPEQAAYLKAGEDWAERAEAGMEDMQTMLFEGGSRPELILDDGWRQRLKRVLDRLNQDHEEMMSVEVPAGAEATHRALVRVAETAIEANELLWQGVLDVDAELLSQAGVKIDEMVVLLEEGVTTVERFCE